MSYVELNMRHSLNEVLVTLIGESERSRILKGAVEGLMNIFRSPFSILAMVNTEKKLVENLLLVSRVQDSKDINTLREIDITHIVEQGSYWDFIYSLIEDDTPMLVKDLSIIVDPTVREYAHQIQQSRRLVSFAVIPIHSDIKGVVGGIVLGLRRNLSREEIKVLKEFAYKFARILDFIDKLKEADFKDREAQLLISLLQNVTAADIERNLRQVVKNIVELLNLDLAAIAELDRSRNLLEVTTVYGVGRDIVTGIKLKLEDCPRLAEALQSGKPFQVKEQFDTDCVPKELKPLLNLSTILKLPMFDSHGKPIGMFFAIKKRIKEFDPSEITIVEQFAEIAALTIEKYRLTQEIIEAKSYLDAVFNGQQDALLIIDPKSAEVRDVNKRFFELFRVEPEDIIRVPFDTALSRFMPVEQLKDSFNEVLDREKAVHLSKIKGHAHDGTTAYYDIVISPIFTSSRITSVLISIRDITKEVELEEKMQAINDLGRELLTLKDPKKVADAVCDIAERVIEFREFILALIDEFRGTIIVYAKRGEGDSYKVGMALPSSDKCVLNAVTFMEPQNYPVSKSNYPELCVPIRDKNDVIGVIKVVGKTPNSEFDDSDQRLLMALGAQAGMAIRNARLIVRLRDAQRQYKLLLDNANDVILIIDKNGIIREANKFASNLTGYPKHEIVGKHISEFILPEYPDAQLLPDQNLNKGVRLEGSLITVLGQKIPVEWSASAVTVKRELLFLGIARDLSEQKRAERLLKSLNVAALAVMRHISEKEIFNTIGKELNKLGFKSAILILDSHNGYFRVKYISDSSSKMLYQKIKTSDVPELFEVIKTKRTKLVEKLSVNLFPNNQVIAAPLSKNSRPFGLLVVFSNNVNERDIPAINLFAHQVAIALENASLYQEIKAHAENLSKILQLSVSINAVPSMDDTLRVLTGMTASVMGIPFAFVALYDESINALKGVSPSYGMPEKFLENTIIPITNESLAARVFRTGKVVFINDINQVNIEFKELSIKLGIRRMLLTPLKVENKVIGVFYLGKRSHDPPFTENEARVFAILANHAATAIRNAQLFDELKMTLNKLEHTYDITLEALVSALDFREHETQFHSQRVAKYSERIAIELGITDDELRYIYWGSLLHDVGKIGIPDAILLKPGKLSDGEWEIMKKHPLIGFKIVETIDFLGPARDIVLYHHERWDGRGYPFGLKEEEIPLGARIFAFADTLDAITSDRPYRKALSFEYAIQEIAKNRGKQFDPLITDVFLSIPLEEWKIIRTSLSEKANMKKQKSQYVTPHGEEIPEIDHIIKW